MSSPAAPPRAPEGKVPIFESAGQAVRFLIENWRFALIVGLIGAAAVTLSSLLLGPLGPVGSTFAASACYAALLGASMFGAANVRARIRGDALRVWASMTLLGAFLAIIFTVIAVLFMSVLIGPYGEEVQAAGENQELLMEIFSRAISERRGVAFALLAASGAIWLMITSRLYLAAPATVESKRIRLFETWRWTQGNMLRICGARLAVLGPALILTGAIQSAVGIALGLPVTGANALSLLPALAQASSATIVVYLFLGQVVQIGLYAALEAGLSSYLHRGLKPETTEHTFA